MLLFFYPLLLAGVIALVIDQSFEVFVLPKRTDLDNSFKVERLLGETDPKEIPVFGSSKGRSSFIPDSLGETVFNYSMQKCNFDVIFFLLETELAKDKDAPIIIEFNARSFVHRPQHTIDLATFMPIKNNPSVVEYLAANDRLDNFQLVPGVRYYGSYVRYIRSLNRKETPNKIINRGGLFIDYYPGDRLLRRFTDSRYKMIEKREELETRAASGKPLTYMEDQMLDQLQISLDFAYNKDRIKKFEDMVKSHPNRDILMVFTPHHPSELAGLKNREKLYELMDHWNEDIPNLYAFDYSDFPLPDSCFKNSSHINLEGARRFCAVLNDDLAHLLN
ncbi:MAG: hypothetical protein MK086_06100 [Flavobacteriales bacterium]|nr:hypothetical protein [Flavobacteriales bacterium]